MVAFWLSFSCWQSSRCSGSTGGEEDHTSPPAPPPWQHQPYPPIWEPLPIKVIRQPATGALHFIRDGEKTNSWQRNTRRKKKPPTKQTWADFQTITTGMPSQNLARVQRPLREWCSATQRKQIHQVPTLVPPPSLSQWWDCITQLQKVIWTCEHPCLPSIWCCSAVWEWILCVCFSAVQMHASALDWHCVVQDLMLALLLPGEKGGCISVQLSGLKTTVGHREVRLDQWRAEPITELFIQSPA